MNTMTMKVTQIITNPGQPRKYFNEDALNELASSIKADGLQEPILVRPKGDKYEIVQGERRYRAHIIAGLDEIQVKVKDLSDNDAFHLSVIENLQREQMTPIEEAQAFYKYVEMGLTHEQIAHKVSKSRTYVTSRLRLLHLSSEIQDWISKGKISDGHAKKLLTARNDLCKWMEVCLLIHKTNDPFEFIQSEFTREFKDKSKISVNDVSDWLDEIKSLAIWSNLEWLIFLARKDNFEDKIGDSVEIKKNNAECRDIIRKIGVFVASVALKYGFMYEKINSEVLEFYFEHKKKQEKDIKAWRLFKALEEWTEFIKENPFNELDTDEIVSRLKLRDLHNELLTF
jgi:ParB/RepB/Spo0J family partition protein